MEAATDIKPLDPLRSLSEIPGLGRLPEICERFGVEITGFGSVIRRLAFVMMSGKATTVPSLFDLAPFLSDIDLMHSGSPEQTPAIRDAIMAAVPWSECFRWEISSEATLKPYMDDEVHLPLIPLNKLTLPTRAGKGLVDPFNAAEDIRRHRFRLEANPFYGRSALRASHRDCGILHAIFFLELLCEHGNAESMDEHPGWQVCRDLIDSSGDETAVSLGESAYLRARLRDRFQAMYAACGSRWQWEVAFSKSGLDAKLGRRGSLARYDYGFFTSFDLRFLGVSCRLGGDRYRLRYDTTDLLLDGILGGDQPKADGLVLWDSMLETHQPLSAISAHPLPQLASGQVIVGASVRVGLNEGAASGSVLHEHVHIEIPLSAGDARICAEAGDENLGVIAVLSAHEEFRNDDEVAPYSCAVPLPGVCTFRRLEGLSRDGDVIRARINFGRILEVFPGIVRRAGHTSLRHCSLQVFVVAEHEH